MFQLAFLNHYGQCLLREIIFFYVYALNDYAVVSSHCLES